MTSVLDSAVFPIYVQLVPASSQTTDLTTGEKAAIKMPFNFEVVAVTAPPASVAPVGAAVLIDVEIAGTSVFDTRLTVADGATAISGNDLDDEIVQVADNNGPFDDAGTWGAKDDVLSVDVDQVGSTTAGDLASVTVWVKRR